MVVGLRDEARNRKCAVLQTLVSCHVLAHDTAFGGLDSSASAERTLALPSTSVSLCSILFQAENALTDLDCSIEFAWLRF